ncbi:MAG: hypothetical protein HS104_08190 [Polyangiaceae bacterium]|nr:hypothetical protein [Polyangiaceae bacterium]MCE7891878.1 hypothetical protein [Sorangiineae bacterium PRO1]MCL4749267.1 hypothetical protein [Myxococcales bacterium]
MGKKEKTKAKSAGSSSAKPEKSASKKGAAKGAAAAADNDPKRSGLRGAAPWAARHAAKHAAEARARNASPPPPGSARATLRVPEKAELIKAKVAELHNAMVRIRALRKHPNEKFYELGQVLGMIRDGRLYEAKGFNSFEAFVEREVDLSKATTLRLERVPRLFYEAQAREVGLEAVLAAVEAIDAVLTGQRQPAARAQQAAALPLKPPTGRK